MEPTVEAFLKHDYAQTIDLGKAFITLLSAILVLSVTFAEKIINWETAERTSKALLLTCWGQLITAIILCGASLSLTFAAAVAAVHKEIPWAVPLYGKIDDYFETVSFAWFVMGLSGCSFVISIILLPVVAI